MNENLTAQSPELYEDVLYGAEAIAEFLFGHRKKRRKVYYLAEHTRLPVFRIGSTLCARRSTLLNWISGQEGGRPPRKR
jgi:hypothetical protein